MSRQLAYVSGYTTDIRHIKGEENTVADTLSRAVAVVVPTSPPLDYAAVAEAQREDPDLQRLLNESTALQLQQMESPGSHCLLWCDVSCGQPCPFIPQQYRRQVFLHYHSLAHPGIRGTQRIIGKRVVWPYMKRDIQ